MTIIVLILPVENPITGTDLAMIIVEIIHHQTTSGEDRIMIVEEIKTGEINRIQVVGILKTGLLLRIVQLTGDKIQNQTEVLEIHCATETQLTVHPLKTV